MQALSHFSYDYSDGQLLLCDLQGTIRSGGKGAVLTDPVILSCSHSYGKTDLGPKGISTFFARHTCSSFCDGNWKLPASSCAYYTSYEGTTMELTQPERPPRVITHQPAICEGSEDGCGAEDDEESEDDQSSKSVQDVEDDEDASWSTVYEVE